MVRGRSNMSKVDQSQASLHYLQEIFKCGICASPLKNPVETRQCGHVFCNICLKKLLGSQPSSRTISQTSCPICKDKLSRKSVKSRQDVEVQMDAFHNLISAFTTFKENRAHSRSTTSGSSVTDCGTETITAFINGAETAECSEGAGRSTVALKSKKTRTTSQESCLSSPTSSQTRRSLQKSSQNFNRVSEMEVDSRRKSLAVGRPTQKMPYDGRKSGELLSKDSLQTEEQMHPIEGTHEQSNDSNVDRPLDLSITLTKSQKSQVPRTPKIAFEVDPSLALDLSSKKNTSTGDSSKADTPSGFAHRLYPRRSHVTTNNAPKSIAASYSDPRQFNLDFCGSSPSLSNKFIKNDKLRGSFVAANLSTHLKPQQAVSFDAIDTPNRNPNYKSKLGSPRSSAPKRSQNSSKSSRSEENTQEKAENALLNLCGENFEQMTCRGDDVLLNCDLDFENDKGTPGKPSQNLVTENSNHSSGEKKRSVQEAYEDHDVDKMTSIQASRVNKKLRMTPLSPPHSPSPRKSAKISNQNGKVQNEAEDSSTKTGVGDGGKENEMDWVVGGDECNFSDSDGSEDLFFSTPKSTRSQSPKAQTPIAVAPLERLTAPQRSSPRTHSRTSRLDINSSAVTKTNDTPNSSKNKIGASSERDFDPFDDGFDEQIFADCGNDNNIGTVTDHDIIGIDCDSKKTDTAGCDENPIKSPQQKQVNKGLSLNNNVTPIRNKTALVWGDNLTPVKTSVLVPSPATRSASATRQLTPKSQQKADFVTPTKSRSEAYFSKNSALAGSNSQGKAVTIFSSNATTSSTTPLKLTDVGVSLTSPFKPHTPGKLTPIKGRKNFVFCPTRLSKYQQLKLNQLCDMCGGKISKDYADDVTHLVLTLESKRVPQTMKYLFAIAGKKWVVVFDWVEECLRQKKIVSEELFETSSFKGCDAGVMKSRLATTPLFKGFSFHVLGNLKSSGASIEDWRKLLKKLGASIILEGNLVTRDALIVGDSSDVANDYQDWFISKQVITVAWEWILDCVLSYSLIPLVKDHYLITNCSAQELAEIGLPNELLP